MGFLYPAGGSSKWVEFCELCWSYAGRLLADCWQIAGGTLSITFETTHFRSSTRTSVRTKSEINYEYNRVTLPCCVGFNSRNYFKIDWLFVIIIFSLIYFQYRILFVTRSIIGLNIIIQELKVNCSMIEKYYRSYNYNSSYQHKFGLIRFIWESNYAIDCWRHLQASQIVPGDHDSSERYNRFLMLHQWAKIWDGWNYRP